MHLLAAQAGEIQQEGEAIDLGQSPAPMLFLSAADSELSLLAGAADRAGETGLRLASLLRLSHNLSVDLWVEQTARHARLIVVRLLGGAAYWRYGVDELIGLCAERGIGLVLLPGEAVPDPALIERSSIAEADWHRLHALFTAGGPDNADAVLQAMRMLAAAPLPSSPTRGEVKNGAFGTALPQAQPGTLPLLGRAGEGVLSALATRPFLRFGHWHPETGVTETARRSGGRPVIPILFYRAALEGAGTATLEALVGALEARGLAPMPLLVSTLKEAACVRFVRSALQAEPPAAIFNLTGFALGLDGLDEKLNPFATTDAPVIQLVQSGRPEASWRGDMQGLSSRDLAMQVVLPELDGRIGGLIVGHKAEAVWHARTECPLSAYAPDADGVARAVDLAANWARLRATPRGERRVGIVLANYPIRDGRLANGVGYDAPASTVEILRVLGEAGYDLSTAVTPTPDPSPQGGGEPSQSPGRNRLAEPAVLPLPSPLRGGVGGGGMNARHARIPKDSVRARSLRNGSTPPERTLWSLLRGFRPDGYHFRRQVPIGPYFADFATHHPKFIIELDGETHGTDAAIGRDADRAAFLERAGYRVLRLANRDVSGNPEGVWQAISDALARLTSPLSAGGTRLTARVPATGNALIEMLQAGPTNAHPEREGGISFSLARYRTLFETLPEPIRRDVTARWGAPEADPFVRDGAFHLPALRFGNVAVLLQPARGYDRDISASYHDPDLVPPHAYVAAYLWLGQEFGAHALIHSGKHGSLEWLPGKANALDAASYPLALWGALPHLYPFIVNDPGEGTQAKRRTGAVIIDHLVPPLTRAETYGPLKDLEALLDEYYAASGMDRRRLKDLCKRILDFTRDSRLDRDIALGADEDEALKRIDTFLCDLKEAQIRDGLHIFGHSPSGPLERDLVVALARVPRGEGPGEASLIRALADDLQLGLDPLTADLGATWQGPREGLPHVTSPSPTLPTEGEGVGRVLGTAMPQALRGTSPLVGEVGRGERSAPATLRTVGDVVEHLEALAAELVDGRAPEADWRATRAVLETIGSIIRPRVAASGPAEMAALLDGLDGKFVQPGPSGAPTRGRLDVLPTGRNFYSVDNRAVPTPTAWELGRKSAEGLLKRHQQDHGNPLRALALSVWGTSNMRTGGDDIAQALAFIGVRPVWDPGSLRVSGYEIIPLPRLGRPRVDVTLRISGLFRDAFPLQIALFDRAIRAVGALDEPEDDNPIAARMRSEALGLMGEGASEAEAARQAGQRIFGSKPGAYGAGLQGLIDSGKWRGKGDLAEAFLNWGQYAYGAAEAGTPSRARFAARLGAIEAVVHNQDNREHDLLDSDDYYQFEGGLVATAEAVSGHRPVAWHNDHSRPERPLARTLEEEISKVMRSRVVNPKWIAGVMRHGYKGAFEIIATVDYMFAFAATTGAVKTHHFDLAFSAFVEDEAVAGFIRENNRYGWDELRAKFAEARERGFWTPQSNRAHELLGVADAR